MIAFIYDKIKDLKYTNEEDLQRLDTFLAVLPYAIDDYYRSDEKADTRRFFYDQIEDIRRTDVYWLPVKEDIIEEKFDTIKQKALNCLDGFVMFLGGNFLWEKSADDILKGEEKTLLNKEIQLSLLLVELKHIEYFKNDNSTNPYDKNERLMTYYESYFDNYTYSFRFIESCPIPKEIIIEATNAVKSILETFPNLK